jgi:hypothetical protein
MVMNKYNVDLTFPRGSRQPIYSLTLDAVSQSQAIESAKMAARQEGWKGEPIKAKAVMV